MAPTVSLTMIVRDEARDLGRCLFSAAGLADEVVVVDTGSADATRDVARRFGARVVDLPWPDSFAAARNASLDHARGEWAFWLDADEWLDNDAREATAALFGRLRGGGEGGNAVYLMRQESTGPSPAAGRLAVDHPRVFRNHPAVRWRNRVHEQILGPCARPRARRWSPPASRSATRATSPGRTPWPSGPGTSASWDSTWPRTPETPSCSFNWPGSGWTDDFPAAEAALGRVLAAVPPADPLARQARAFAGPSATAPAGRRGRAWRVVRAGLAAAPNDTNLLHEAGSLAFEAGRLDEAAAAFAALLGAAADPGERFDAVDPTPSRLAGPAQPGRRRPRGGPARRGRGRRGGSPSPRSPPPPGPGSGWRTCTSARPVGPSSRPPTPGSSPPRRPAQDVPPAAAPYLRARACLARGDEAGASAAYRVCGRARPRPATRPAGTPPTPPRPGAPPPDPDPSRPAVRPGRPAAGRVPFRPARPGGPGRATPAAQAG